MQPTIVPGNERTKLLTPPDNSAVQPIKFDDDRAYTPTLSIRCIPPAIAIPKHGANINLKFFIYIPNILGSITPPTMAEIAHSLQVNFVFLFFDLKEIAKSVTATIKN